MTLNQVVFVSDLFVEDYAGGAELTSQAIIDQSPYNVRKVHAKDVNVKMLQDYQNDYWIFGNFSSIDFNLIPAIVANINYSVIEYDYKFCNYRSIEKHKLATGVDCDCANNHIGKYVSAFYYAADHIFWMSIGQRDRYHAYFPHLVKRNQTVLSSIFDPNFFNVVEVMKNSADTRQGWIVLGSDSWIKGKEDAIKWCQDNGKDYEVIWDLSYEEVLGKLASAEGFVYLPRGGDTCPRMVIEAKLLGCTVVTNDNVQHQNEDWWQLSPELICDYLQKRPMLLWSTLSKFIRRQQTISGYTTTYNCVSQNYPFVESIMSMIDCLDEVIIVDGGSTDGTLSILNELAKDHPKLRVIENRRDWNHKRSAVFDGDQKAVARSYCTGDFCWQMDVDEIIHQNDYPKVRDLIDKVHKSHQLIALPVVEFWGNKGKIRIDINPWKWRLSRNYPHITHGIPAHLRRTDSEGLLYAAQGTDGCDYVHSETGDLIPFVNFHTTETEQLRQNGQVSELFRAKYIDWFKQVVDVLPGVYHYSWFDIPRKIRTYRGFWTRHWQSLFDIKQEDTPANNMFFDKRWVDVTDEEIDRLAEKLQDKLGGWIFHRKIDWDNPTPSVKLPGLTHPDSMIDWMLDNE